MKTTIKISGMSCGHCVMGVKGALKSVPGIKEMDVIIGQAVLETAEGFDISKAKAAIEEEGYDVVAVS